jgi:hypothetical protein
MPISDASYMLRTASDGLLDGTEALTGVDIGPGPAHGMLARIYLPLDATTVTMNIAECATLGGSYVDLDNGPWTFTVGVKTYMRRIYWTKRYLRFEVTACTGSFGYATVGIAQGAEPN